jgi:hypothetical protein
MLCDDQVERRKLLERDPLDETDGFDSGLEGGVEAPVIVATMESGMTEPQEGQDRLSSESS